MCAGVVSHVAPCRINIRRLTEKCVCLKRREVWLTELFRELGWLSLFHFLKQPSAAHDCDGLNTDAER